MTGQSIGKRQSRDCVSLSFEFRSGAEGSVLKRDRDIPTRVGIDFFHLSRDRDGIEVENLVGTGTGFDRHSECFYVVPGPNRDISTSGWDGIGIEKNIGLVTKREQD